MQKERYSPELHNSGNSVSNSAHSHRISLKIEDDVERGREARSGRERGPRRARLALVQVHAAYVSLLVPPCVFITVSNSPCASLTYAVRVLFGQTEWHRICGPMGNHVDEQDRMVRFRTSLALSSALVSTSNAVFDFEAFPVRLSLLSVEPIWNRGYGMLIGRLCIC